MSASVLLVGRVVRGPEAVDDWRYPDRLLVFVAVDGLAARDQPVEWVQVVALDSPEVRALAVGDVVEAAGLLRLARWTRTDGARRRALKVIADTLRPAGCRSERRELLEVIA